MFATVNGITLSEVLKLATGMNKIDGSETISEALAEAEQLAKLFSEK